MVHVVVGVVVWVVMIVHGSVCLFLGLFAHGVSRCPAPGFRDSGYEAGVLHCGGSHGFSWSSASNASGRNGMSLNFQSQTLNTGNSDTRAHGFQLRCLSE